MSSLRVSAPQRVGDLLTRAVPALAEHLVEDTIRREWPLAVGPELARRSRPGPLARGVLEVWADNSPWLAELTMRSGELLSALRGRYGPVVASVHCTLGPVTREPRVARPSRPAPAQAAPALSAEDMREIETALAPVTDPELAAALRRLLTRDRLARRPPAAARPAERTSS